jgi:hypothetical protein
VAKDKTIEEEIPSPGRRAWDHRAFQAWWVLIIGAMFQGGNYLIVKEMMARDDHQREAERVLLGQQHDQMMKHYEIQTQALRDLTEQLRRAVDRLDDVPSRSVGRRP